MAMARSENDGRGLEHEVAYELLLTLLEHQFSSPVQWISTQDSLLDDQARRYIEIGPSDTLKSMLQQTVTQKQDDGSDAIYDREFLTFSDILDELQTQDETDTESIDDSASDADRAEASAPPAPAEVKLPKPQPVKVELKDAPASASEALLAIVASGLRSARAGIDTSQSVKSLARGRSALQNEIVGNLAAEFGPLPDAVEDMALVELAAALQPTFGGGLGRFLNEWLANKVKAKLAPGLTIPKLRARLRESYGLKEGRQDSFFLTADFDEIASRLKDEQQSWEIVHRWADAHVKTRGLQQHVMGREEEDGMELSPPSAAPAVASPQVAKFGRELTDLMAKHFPPGPADISEAALQQHERELEKAALDHLTKELGPEFIAGVRPCFRPQAVHRYQSSWNWAVQDLYVTLSAVAARVRAESSESQGSEQYWLRSESERLRNRATPRMLRCAEYLRNKWERISGNPGAEACLTLLRGLLALDDAATDGSDASYQSKPPEQEGKTIRNGNGWHNVKIPSDFDLAETSSSSSPSSPPCGTYREHRLPRLCTRSASGAWETNPELTNLLRAPDADAAGTGTVLIMGAGTQSIGFALVKQLLAGGWRVALCSSRLTADTRRTYARLYARTAKPGAELVLLPCNQGSIQDVAALVDYIHVTLAWEIDHVVPFAAVSELGRTLEDLDSTSELAHRVMLTNTLRLMGRIVTTKRQRHVLNHTTQVLLPLSPNHGQLGGDGLYAESKLALEALLNKWSSESWGDALCVCGVRIGWTRGTGVMAANDAIAGEAEKLGVRTFSSDEMAVLLLGVMSPSIWQACSVEPILCDFTGGLGAVPNLAGHMNAARVAHQDAVAVKRRLEDEAKRDRAIEEASADAAHCGGDDVDVRAGIRDDFPVLPERYDEAVPGDVARLRGLLDLESLPVIAGFAELGSAGSSRTRWELEAYGEFSIEGCIELAWMTGLIRYDRRRLRDGVDAGPGWTRCDTGEPIRDVDIKSQLEASIRQHTGIRIVEPDASCNPDPRLRDMLHEVGTQEDLPPFECSGQAADALRARHGDAVEVLARDGETATVRIRRGTSIFVPKALNTSYFVGAQVPAGWDAARYGIPADVLTQADRPALYALVCAVEAFLAAGLIDVYELYRYIHVSDVGNCLGSGGGGSTAIQAFHEHRLLGREVRSDILSEAFVGTAAAWVNLLLLSASGPIKTGAGTCATSLESLDTACDLIRSGRAKICLAGGYDVFTRPVFYEFGEMRALADAAHDVDCGREPAEMSRPFTTSRGGFVLSDGAGVQVVSSAALALAMGLPIYGVVALTHMAADKAGRSVPSPGSGILTSASQVSAATSMMPCLLADPVLRAKRIRRSLDHIDRQTETDVETARTEWTARGDASLAEPHVEAIRQAAQRERRAVLRALGHDFWREDARMSPLAGALSVFGLTVHDVTFASLHGTATRLNDLNECAVLDRQMRHLGRDPANPLLTVAQKSVVGHGVGASGAWALNGALQAMHSGVIPGNRNADDIDPRLAQFECLLLTNENIVLPPHEVRAFSVTSFGFGQKGAQAVVVHPRYLYAAVTEAEYSAYRDRVTVRTPVACRELDRGLHGEGMVKVKEAPPYAGDEHDFLLDPLARAASTGK